MSELAAREPARTLFDTAMPGAHDACSYAVSARSPVVSGGLLAALRDLLLDASGREVVAGWARAQEHTVANQCALGVRYFDIRLCERDGAWWTHHGLLSTPWEDVETQLVSFARQNPGEVMVLDFHEFAEVADGGVSFCQGVQARLGGLVVPPGRVRDPLATLGREGTSFVLRATREATAGGRCERFIDTGLIDSEAHWADTAFAPQLEGEVHYHLTDRDPSKLDVVQGVLTLNAEVLARGSPRGLRELASPVTSALPGWVARAPRPLVNVVMADFVDPAFCGAIVALNASRAPYDREAALRALAALSRRPCDLHGGLWGTFVVRCFDGHDDEVSGVTETHWCEAPGCSLRAVAGGNAMVVCPAGHASGVSGVTRSHMCPVPGCGRECRR